MDKCPCSMSPGHERNVFGAYAGSQSIRGCEPAQSQLNDALAGHKRWYLHGCVTIRAEMSKYVVEVLICGFEDSFRLYGTKLIQTRLAKLWHSFPRDPFATVRLNLLTCIAMT
jgi:hypothetical protein